MRARVQYHSQLGLYASGVDETTVERLRLVAEYVKVFTGVEPTPGELDRFRTTVRHIEKEAR